MVSRSRSILLVGALAVFGGLAVAIWVAPRPSPLAGNPGAVDCSAPPHRNEITGTVAGDVVVTAHGAICSIRGTVDGNVMVRDQSDECATQEPVTAVKIAGGTVRGDIGASGRGCVMVWLGDGARVGGDILYEAEGNLGFLAKRAGAVVGGDVLVRGGLLWATGGSRDNRIAGNVVCEGGAPKGGPGSATNWDGAENDVDGTIGGAYRC